MRDTHSEEIRDTHSFDFQSGEKCGCLRFRPLFYIGAFTLIGMFAHYVTRFLCWKSARLFLLSVFLLLPIFCSLARVLTYSIFYGRDGTYTFWEAVDRYFEKRQR
jgi:hypothetical protein